MYAAYTEMNLNGGTKRGERVLHAPKRRVYCYVIWCNSTLSTQHYC
jgi:hypothetical protein